MSLERCPRCGGEINDGDLFCPVCGSRLQAEGKTSVSVCPACGSEQDAGNTFCSACGALLKKKDHSKRKKRLKKALAVTGAVMVALLVICTAVSFAAAGSAGNLRRWNRAVRYLASGNLPNACAELEKLDGPLAPVILDHAMKRAYRKGVRAYRTGEYGTASQYFSVSGDIGDSAAYRAFSSAHIPTYYYNEVTCSKLLACIMENWEFEDAPDALVSNNSLAQYWLAGRWETADGKHYLALDKESLTYNLPHESFGDTFRVYSCYVQFYYNGQEDAVQGFRLYPMDMDTMSVYCIDNGEYYNLYRIVPE